MSNTPERSAETVFAVITDLLPRVAEEGALHQTMDNLKLSDSREDFPNLLLRHIRRASFPG